jgi:hypothetical protein
MAVIKVPRTPKKAFDPDRPASDLLRRQVEHLEWAVRPASERKPDMLPKRGPKTEGEAAAKIEKLTAAVLEQARKDAETAAAPGGFAAAATSRVAAEPAARKGAARPRKSRRRRSTPRKRASSGRTRRRR